jgi:hypothetical protein
VKIKLTDQATRKAFVLTVAVAWLAFLLGLRSCATDLVHRPPQAIQVQKEIGDYTAASFFAKNFVTLYLGGSGDNANALAQMTLLIEPPKLPPDPYTVLDVNILKPTRIQAGSHAEWTFIAAATLIPPGAGGAQRNYFFVNVLESSSGTFRAMTYPRLVNYNPPPFEMETLYTVGAALNGPLGQMLHNFMTAFYQNGNEGQLGRFVTQNFHDRPVTRSPFTSVEVKSIAVANNSPDPTQAKSGDILHIMVTAKGASSATTWSFFQSALAVTLSKDNQWLVDKFDDAIDFGKVSIK